VGDYYHETGAMLTLILSSDVADGAKLVGYLRQGGYSAIVVTSVEEARQVLVSQPFDVVLLESTVGDNDCFALCRELRERFGYQLLIIFISTINTPARRVAGIEIGADDFVGTSCTADELLARIEAGYRRHIPKMVRDCSLVSDICSTTQLDLNSG
jgi:DNA-binding response OmpR family regulator